ncbi:MAG: hypothetical protein KI792_09060 [Alphaproteobacteria bacterium]|nr:hypothetical protein [Alphaproteobacteria bacterium SS10]
MVTNQQTSTAEEGKSRVPMGLVATGVVAVPAAIGLTILKLASGPDAAQPTPAPIPVVQIDPSVIGPDAPVQPLGVGEPGDWRLGTITRHVVSIGDEVRLPTINIDPSAITPGRYHYDGDVVLTGDLTQPYVEITAKSITVDGDVSADSVRLMTIEEAPVRDDPDMLFYGRGDRSFAVLTSWDHHYHRGDVTIGGSVTGDDIDVVASEIRIRGDVSGEVDLAASGGEWTSAVLTESHGRTVDSVQSYRDPSIGPDQYNESIRMGLQRPDQVIQIGGTIEGDVSQIIPRIWASEHGFTQPTAASIVAATQVAATPDADTPTLRRP